jgi:hypothetical protein
MNATSTAHSASKGFEQQEEQVAVKELRHGNVAGWIELIRAEYNEMPGLQLTKRQVQRLWGLDDVTCEASLRALEDQRFLRRTPANFYVRSEECY